MKWDPYPYLSQRPSEVVRVARTRNESIGDMVDLYDFNMSLEKLEQLADDITEKEVIQKQTLEDMNAKIDELRSEIQSLNETHAEDLDDFRASAATEREIVRTVETAFEKMGIRLPADASDWSVETVMEQFAERMVELS